MTGIRMNLSHGPLSAHKDWLDIIHAVGIPQLLIDLQGPELRIGTLPQPLVLKPGQSLRLGQGGVPCPAALVHAARPGQNLLLDDGRLLVQVAEADGAALQCTVVRGGTLQSRKSLAAPGLTVASPTLTEEDLQNLQLAGASGVTGVMLPFVRGAEDIRTLRRALEQAGAGQIRIFAKIESLAGVQALPEFLPLVDEVVIARKARKPFRDKLMGRLDSLAQMNLNSVYVCTSCGLLLNYNPDYQGHHALVGEGGCPAKGRKQPVDGETYRIAKYKYYGDSKGGGVYFSVVDAHSVVYHATEFTEEELLRMNNMWRVKGYYGKREFYQPDEIDMQLPVPDARNTLLWAPSVVTDEKGEATVSFYCSDINTGFIGVAEGVDGTGLLGTDQCEFRVIRRAD